MIPRLRPPEKKAHRPAEKYQQRQLEQPARKTERVRESYVGRSGIGGKVRRGTPGDWDIRSRLFIFVV